MRIQIRAETATTLTSHVSFFKSPKRVKFHAAKVGLTAKSRHAPTATAHKWLACTNGSWASQVRLTSPGLLAPVEATSGRGFSLSDQFLVRREIFWCAARVAETKTPAEARAKLV